MIVMSKHINFSIDGNYTDDDEGSTEGSRQHKPWGDAHHFCPVALRNYNVLWPGSNEISLRYPWPLIIVQNFYQGGVYCTGIKKRYIVSVQKKLRKSSMLILCTIQHHLSLLRYTDTLQTVNQSVWNQGHAVTV